jgi:hypothetical protein
MTAPQLQQFGVPHLAYVKAGCVDGGGMVHFIHAADGQLLAIVDNFNLALEFALHNSLILVPTHGASVLATSSC